MHDILVRELRGIFKAIDDLQRRSIASHMTGKVAAIDGNRVRLELLPQDSRTGKPFLSPWVQVQEAAGATGTRFPVALGDPLRLFSPNGEIGSQSIAIRDGYTDAAQSPATGDELALSHGGCTIRMSAGRVMIEADAIEFSSGTFNHNDTNVGSTHVHGGVERGGARTNQPS